MPKSTCWNMPTRMSALRFWVLSELAERGRNLHMETRSFSTKSPQSVLTTQNPPPGTCRREIERCNYSCLGALIKHGHICVWPSGAKRNARRCRQNNGTRRSPRIVFIGNRDKGFRGAKTRRFRTHFSGGNRRGRLTSPRERVPRARDNRLWLRKRFGQKLRLRKIRGKLSRLGRSKIGPRRRSLRHKKLRSRSKKLRPSKAMRHRSTKLRRRSHKLRPRKKLRLLSKMSRAEAR